MSKHPVSAPQQKGGKVVPAARTMTVFSEYEKKHVQMTLEQAVRDSIKYWASPSWGVSAEWFDEDKTVTATMKRCGYEPVLNKNGKFAPVSGVYNFQPIPKNENP